jgi:hypothetical protein
MYDIENVGCICWLSNLKQRYLDHTRYIRNNNPQSAYAAHILNNIHEYKLKYMIGITTG